LLVIGLSGYVGAAAQGVQVTANEAQKRVDVTIDGAPFTSYIWPDTLTKPVLFPLIAGDGTTVTRGYPLEPRPGERTDHPHHAGMWFNYGNVNGFDFWNNSSAIPADRKPKMGSIVQDKILSVQSGAKSGELDTESEWVTGAGDAILDDVTRYVFSTQGEARVIDQITTLKALDKAIFNDDKEGLLGLRVASWLESPTEKGGTFTDASGKATRVSATGSVGASGVYLTSEGKRGDTAWGTRGRWCTLTGTTGGKTYAIAILDHPGNPGYPTYWHARGYGLFAANPLGRHIFDPKAPPFDFTLDKGQAATFRYRVILYTHAVTPEEMNAEADRFAKEYR
jgi:hypothetical protein